ncbi:acyl-CoA dehydrogenase family protein [Amycolatopsis sp. NPDC004079]|uniref:acyl-CoA dehydrogenase family protein n=1 Tax=Amycolatopsis sp. NPDC004079 TaxID=3154549 RepID=UPI00339DB053
MTTHTLEADLDASVSEVIAGWERPGDLREQWRIAARLGWTAILDDLRADAPERDLIDAACGAVTALGRGGIALPLRQTLVARAGTPLSTVDAIAVHPAAQGIWAPIADVHVAADGSAFAEAGRDLADRPYSLLPPTEIPLRLTALSEVLRLQEMLGAAQGAVAEARRYVTERVQFGKPLIAIPAVRTTLGHLKVDVRQLETVTHEVRSRLSGDDGALAFALATAREVAATAVPRIAQTAHQLHGAMGVTYEAALHWRTRLLWADCDEGARWGDDGADAVPVEESVLWSLTAPGSSGGGTRP